MVVGPTAVLKEGSEGTSLAAREHSDLCRFRFGDFRGVLRAVWVDIGVVWLSPGIWAGVAGEAAGI